MLSVNPGSLGRSCQGCKKVKYINKKQNRISIIPVGLEVSKASLQIIEEIHFLAALRTVDVQQLTVVQLAHLLRSLPSTTMKRDTADVLSTEQANT